MGLDMSLYSHQKPKVGENEIAAPFDLAGIDNELVEIGYWRKHSDLHRFIESLYREAGGTGDFNGVRCLLSREHLEEILRRTREDAFEPNEGGSFFGTSNYSCTRGVNLSVEEALKMPVAEDAWPDHHMETYEIIKIAIALQEDGHDIYYDSSW